MITPITDAADAKWIFDVAGYPEKWPDNLPASSDSHVILGSYCPDLVGCFPVQFHELNAEIHAAFLPAFRGDFAVKESREAFQWIWDNTSYQVIVANIELPHVVRFAERCGMIPANGRHEVYKWAAL